MAAPPVAWAQNDQALQTLIATVRSLTALQDVDEVLQAIVGNAHDLVKTDVTHLSLVERDTGKLTVRAVKGDVSDAFRTAQVVADVGVAGRVIATGQPFAVTNYRAAALVKHDPDFDAILRGERIVALAGVPLAVGDEVLGVLHGAFRRARPFRPDELALLSAFADHAAIALENARLYDQKTRALRELSTAYSTIEAHVTALERAAVAHDEMTSLVLSGGTSGEVADLLRRGIEREVVVLDRDDLLTAASRPDVAARLQNHDLLGSDGRPDPALADAIARSAATGHAVTLTARDGTPCTVVAVIAGDNPPGALAVFGRLLHTADLRTVERAAQIIGLLALQREAVLDAEEQVRGEIVTELLASATPATATQRGRATAREIDLDSLETMVVVSCPADQRAAAARTARRVAREAHGLAGEHLGTLVVIVPGRDHKAQAHRVHEALRPIADPPLVTCSAPLDLAAAPAREAFTLAHRSCRLLLALGAQDESACASDLALYAMILHPSRDSDLVTFLETTLGPVRAYDVKGRTDLLGTIGAYFRNSGNLARTASELHVHINTLLRRLDRISSLIGDDWREPRRALEIHLAIRLRALADEFDGAEQPNG